LIDVAQTPWILKACKEESTMRDVYGRRLSKKTLAIDGAFGDYMCWPTRIDYYTARCAPQDRTQRVSMSNSMVFPIATDIKRILATSFCSLFEGKTDEKDLAARNHTRREGFIKQHSARTNASNLSLADRTFSEVSGQANSELDSDRTATSDSSVDRHLDLSNHGGRCPLCFNNLSPADLAHPPQCDTSKCSFNFCLSCAESYISSSKDPYQTASDGSKQLKIFLRCPSCRSDLSTTLRDTVLLRHADLVASARGACRDDEIKLTSSDLSLQHAMSDPFIQTAVSVAQEKEAAFLRDGVVDQDNVPPLSPAAGPSGANCSDDDTGQNRRHSFLYSLIMEAKQAREKKQEMDIHHRCTHNRRPSAETI
jgi:hypothetical protein